MASLSFTFVSLLALLSPLSVSAANSQQWKSRSIYQVITDRFALPQSDPPLPTNACISTVANASSVPQTWCGGTWKAIEQNLDYIQNMGFTAIWISPVSQNIPGPTAYGDPYHGYWIQDVTQLNAKFGTSDDLKSLVTALHGRNMYIMVDIVVNNVAATSSTFTPNYSPYLFKDKSSYHTYCPIDWGNSTSEEQCWLGDPKLPLPDINTSLPSVRDTLASYIKSFVQEYAIDGLRIDAAKHVEIDFWTSFCGENGAAGVFCIGEVYGPDILLAASYQGPLDSIFHYPAYYAVKDAFSIPGPKNISGLVDVVAQSRAKFSDVSVLGNFLENQDLPRWAGYSSDPQSLINALSFNFMNDGIPVIYYGLEQGFKGAGDPDNREPLWPSSYNKTTSAYNTLATLNQFRNFLIAKTDWLSQNASIVGSNDMHLTMMKGNVITVLNTLGSPAANITVTVSNSGYQAGVVMLDILTCKQFGFGSHGALTINYSQGSHALVLYPATYLRGSDICNGSPGIANPSDGGAGYHPPPAAAQSSASIGAQMPRRFATTFIAVLALLGTAAGFGPSL